jgi:hypothetical protein
MTMNLMTLELLRTINKELHAVLCDLDGAETKQTRPSLNLCYETLSGIIRNEEMEWEKKGAKS